MILSKETEDASKASFGKLPSFLRTVIQNSSVKLRGQNEQGATFTGSGAILSSDGTHAWILTAKHNLYIYDGKTDPPVWSAELVTSFRTHIEIFYDGPMTFNKQPERRAAISEIQIVNLSDDDPWGYDVMILKSTDASLRQFAVLNSVGRIKWDHRAYLTDHRKYLKRAAQYFFQVGYGNVRETVADKTLPVDKDKGTASDGGLQFRLTAPIAEATIKVYNILTDGESYHHFDNTIQITATSNTSSAPGDSGGPLYVAYYYKDLRDDTKSEWRLHLIGVTTGSDMSAAEEACPESPSLRDNDISTSLEYCYSENLFPMEESAS